jgi:glycerol-3-phosphate dehydrogenase
VRRCFEHDHAYIFQNPDKRIIFAIPYERDFTLIGTTDQEIHGDPRGAAIAEDEIAYLCAQASRYFKRAHAGRRGVDLRRRAAAAGRCLGRPSAVTRDYLLEPNREGAPLLSVWGGKITTFRKLAEDAATEVEPDAGRGPPALDRRRLPCPAATCTADRPGPPPGHRLRAPGADHWPAPPWLPGPLAHRLAPRGPGGARSARRILAGLGAEVAPGLYRPSCAPAAARGMGPGRRRRAVAAQQAGPAPRRTPARERLAAIAPTRAAEPT